MTIEIVLKAIQDIRSQLDLWGVTAEGLIAVAGLAVIMFIFSLREVVSWFMRVGPLREEIKGLRQDIEELKSMIAAKAAITEDPVAEEPTLEEAPSIKKKDAEKPVKSFRLDH